MEANKILTASLLDLLFETRNKAYGAYELRRSYNKRIAHALIIAGVLVLLLTLGSVFARSLSHGPVEHFKSKEVVLQEIPLEKEEKVIPPPEQKPPPEQTRTEKLTNIVIVPNDQVDEPPPSQDDLQDAVIDVVKAEGRPDDNIATPQDIDGDKGLVEGKKEGDENVIWTKVEIDASFPGGIKKWQQFLERNCNGQVATDNNAAAGRYTVIIRFIVDENGQVSNIVPQTSFGYGMEEEAVKVIKKAGNMKWVPAFQNGKYVKAYRTQPITFVVEE